MSCALGCRYLVHLNGLFYSSSRDLLPNDFVVYTYDKEGSLLSDHPNVQVIYFLLDTLRI
jgi:disintegrin and metalloproteinase domain-containing protein 9